jgi:putative transposase
MQVRWNYKLQPNKGQEILMGEWLVTLRKHRNYSLREREEAYYSNNLKADQPICYAYGAYCDIETRAEYGACCPLTCAVVKHGVIPFPKLVDACLEKNWHPPMERFRVVNVELLKHSKAKIVADKKTGEKRNIPAKTVWDSASGIQGKRTTQLRHENKYYGRIDSDVLQSNLAKLDSAFTGFWNHERGFPAYRKTSTFNSFQFKPGRAQLTIKRDSKYTKGNIKTGEPSKRKPCYSHVFLPGLGVMRFLDSRLIPEDAEIRTVTVKKKADGWYMSVLLDMPVQLPDVGDKEINSSVGIDVGINKLVSLSDGSFIENPRFATNKRTRRQFRIRQRRVNRKVKGSMNRSKAGIQVAKLHKKVTDKRENYQWKAATTIVNTADAIVREDLNIKGMKSRCKVKRDKKGRAMPNGQSAKRGLNRSISDAAWGGLFAKVGWIASKKGKPTIAENPRYSSQECSACGHVSKDNRQGEKFICGSCLHIDHADTQASRTLNKRAGFVFVSNRHKKPTHNRKCLPADCGKVTPIAATSPNGKRRQARNRTSKAVPENRILAVQLTLFNQESPCL